MPVDARLERDTDVEYESVPLDRVLRATAGASLRVVILDACRHNPLTRSMQRTGTTRSVSRGSFGELNEGLQLRSLATAGPEWEGHERAEALIESSGIRLDHVAGDRAYYSLKDDRVVLSERSQFPSQDAYTHTALHELGHATGHPSRLNRPTLVDHGGFGSEKYAREELRVEIAAMMTGEQLGVGHEPRHGTAYVAS